MASSNVRSQTELASCLNDAGSKLVVVEFYYDWCGSSRLISSVLEQMAREMPDVRFLKVDMDACEEELAVNNNIKVVPTFVFFKNGERVGSLSGLRQGMLKEMIEEHTKKA